MKFKVGDMVWCQAFGTGKVIRIDTDKWYPIVVSFDNNNYRRHFTAEGYYDQLRDIEKTIVKRTEFKVDDVVVSDEFGTGKVISINEKVVVRFSDGITRSFTYEGHLDNSISTKYPSLSIKKIPKLIIPEKIDLGDYEGVVSKVESFGDIILYLNVHKKYWE